jgi:hydroxypyruvate isomerase
MIAKPALAHPGGHDGGEYHRPAPKVAAPTATVIPDTFPGVVSALRDGATAAETAVTASKIADLHRSCGTMNDLATAAPAKATGLAAHAQATVATTVTHLQTMVAELVAAADKGDATGAKAAITAIRADVDMLGGLAK